MQPLPISFRARLPPYTPMLCPLIPGVGVEFTTWQWFGWDPLWPLAEHFPKRQNGESFPGGNYLNLALWPPRRVWGGCWYDIIASYREALGIPGYCYDTVANDLFASLFFLPVSSFLLSLIPFHSLLLFPLLLQSASSLCFHCFSLSFHNSIVQSNIICTSHSSNLKKGPGRYQNMFRDSQWWWKVFRVKSKEIQAINLQEEPKKEVCHIKQHAR